MLVLLDHQDLLFLLADAECLLSQEGRKEETRCIVTSLAQRMRALPFTTDAKFDGMVPEQMDGDAAE